MPWFYYVARLIAKILLVLLTSVRVRSKENVPSQGALLIVANHLSLADPPLLGAYLGRKVRFMAKEELFRSRLIGYFVRGFGAFPVSRRRLDRWAIRQAGQLLADGQALVIFPEGMRSLSTQLRPALSGSALVALRHSVPVLPVGITGTEKIRGIAWILRRPRITVNIGHPFYLPVANGKLTKVELAKLTHYIMERIAELLPREYQGIYTGKPRAHED